MTAKYYDIDVVIPVFNGEKYVREAIVSVVNQSYPVKAIYVVDDGSTDNTENVVYDLIKFYNSACIHYVRKENAGPSSARNIGIKACTAKLIAFLDADDYWHPDKLKHQVNLFINDSNGTLGLVYCPYNIVNEKGALIDDEHKSINSKNKGKVFKNLLWGNIILSSASGVLILRSSFQKVGYFDEQLNCAEDWDLWLKISEIYDVNFVDIKGLVNIRFHDKNSQKSTLRMYESELRFFEKWCIRLSAKKYISFAPMKWAYLVSSQLFKNIDDDFYWDETIRCFNDGFSRYCIFKWSFNSFTIFILVMLALNMSLNFCRRLLSIIIFPNIYLRYLRKILGRNK